MRPPRVLGPLLCALAAVAISACGVGSRSGTAGGGSNGSTSASSSRSHGAAKHRQTKPPPPAYPVLTPAATATSSTNFAPAVRWGGHTATWIARRPGLALMSFNQRVVGLRLHSGTIDAGSTGWRYGPKIAGAERRRLVAAFNGGFKFATNSGGFFSYGRTAAALSAGLGSIVTYSDGTTDIGAWHQGVPAAGKQVVAVRQNLHLLISDGRAAANLGCLLCWGATLGGVVAPARSGLGITARGNLVWAGGESLTVQGLADALLSAHALRAVELDINPEWVAGYLYGHRGGRGLAPVPIVPGQPGVPGQFLAPYSRDFFTVVAR